MEALECSLNPPSLRCGGQARKGLNARGKDNPSTSLRTSSGNDNTANDTQKKDFEIKTLKFKLP